MVELISIDFLFNDYQLINQLIDYQSSRLIDYFKNQFFEDIKRLIFSWINHRLIVIDFQFKNNALIN